jgi:hypothetical protein
MDHDESPSAQIDAIIRKTDDWRGDRLTQLRATILDAGVDIVEEVKWKKPSKPEGVPVWSHNGIVCVADTLKGAVRLTFPKGALLKDTKNIFNTRLDSKSVRAVDYHEGDIVDQKSLQALIRDAAELNVPRMRDQ